MPPPANGARRSEKSQPIESEGRVRGNLPRASTRFIGRDSDIAAVRQLLKANRLVTLIGPGGIGKSRLAIAAVSRAESVWPDGVWWVDLTTIGAADSVAGAVASELHLSGTGPSDAVVAGWLGRKTALLILDNCEHVIDSAVQLSQHLLERCGDLSILATSREALAVPAEIRCLVPPLNEADAEALFEERARSVSPKFRITDANRAVVADLCGKLDDLPLAIELAASRLAMMTPHELASGLDDRLHLLTRPNRGAPSRQATMTATIDWSYRLLSASEAALFRRLSIFRAGFTREAAETVCSDAVVPDGLESLAGLVAKSMVVAEAEDHETTRYRLLESQAAYGSERLRESTEFDAIAERHYEYFLAGVLKRVKHLTGSHAHIPEGTSEGVWKLRELGNLWAALKWARNHADDAGLRMATEIGAMESVDLPRARAALSDALRESSALGEDRWDALRVASMLAAKDLDFQSMLTMGIELADLSRQLNDNDRLAVSLGRIASARLALGDSDEGQQPHDEQLRLGRQSSNPRIRALVLNAHAEWEIDNERYGIARELAREAVFEMSRTGDVWHTEMAKGNLAEAEFGCGGIRAAEKLWVELISVAQEFGDYQQIIYALDGLSRIATQRGDHRRALRLAGAEARLRDEFSLKAWPAETRRREIHEHKSRAALPSEVAEHAFREGGVMALEGVIEYAIEGQLKRDTPAVGPLSPKEVDVVRLLPTGMTYDAIARRLYRSPRTVENQVMSSRNKLGLGSRSELTAWAVEHGLASPKHEKEEPETGPSGSERTRR